MARRSRRRPYADPHRELDAATIFRGHARTETGTDGLRWIVRPVSSSDKAYTCPGCHRQIPAGLEHVVTWTEDHLLGPEHGLAERRHWHTRCWQTRR